MTVLWTAVDRSVEWLDAANGRDEHEVTLRILKLVEEVGEAAAARTGQLGQNPRKGVTHTVDDVTGELADLAFTALVGIRSLGADPEATMTATANKIVARLQGPLSA